ncbi:hypothetical protein D3C83_315170 [compost metagenome]
MEHRSGNRVEHEVGSDLAREGAVLLGACDHLGEVESRLRFEAVDDAAAQRDVAVQIGDQPG